LNGSIIATAGLCLLHHQSNARRGIIKATFAVLDLQPKKENKNKKQTKSQMKQKEIVFNRNRLMAQPSICF